MGGRKGGWVWKENGVGGKENRRGKGRVGERVKGWKAERLKGCYGGERVKG